VQSNDFGTRSSNNKRAWIRAIKKTSPFGLACHSSSSSTLLVSPNDGEYQPGTHGDKKDREERAPGEWDARQIRSPGGEKQGPDDDPKPFSREIEKGPDKLCPENDYSYTQQANSGAPLHEKGRPHPHQEQAEAGTGNLACDCCLLVHGEAPVDFDKGRSGNHKAVKHELMRINDSMFGQASN
jgi:hypothetical protein